MIKPGSVIGILGGGQLGRMISLAAANLGYKCCILTPEKNSPASQVSWKTIVADYTDKKALSEFIKLSDVITFEFENVPYETVSHLEKHSTVSPNWKSLYTAQNRLREKTLAKSLSIPTAKFFSIKSLSDLEKAVKKLGDSILKTSEFGYDGKGQFRISKSTNLQDLWKSLKAKELILEEKITFKKEVSVIIARDKAGKAIAFPVQENSHKNGILDTTTVPANISKTVSTTAINYAKKLVSELNLVGLLAVEFFVNSNEKVIFNEMAPRPHNSGHWSMDGCNVSQFEQMVRAVCSLPLITPSITNKTVMKNLIGSDVNLWKKESKNPKAKIHLYGKEEARSGRKMGHINYLK